MSAKRADYYNEIKSGKINLPPSLIIGLGMCLDQIHDLANRKLHAKYSTTGGGPSLSLLPRF